MKFLVFSDSHGTDFYIKKALADHKDAVGCFFLGDGLADVEKFAERGLWYLVRGNCDYSGFLCGSMIPKTAELTVMGKRIVYTHGDLYGVKSGTGGILSLAASRSADLVLYGHTHTPREEYRDGVYLFNPGSISSVYGNTPSYGIITLRENGILLSHGMFL